MRVRICPVARSFEHCNKSLGSVKDGVFCSIKLVTELNSYTKPNSVKILIIYRSIVHITHACTKNSILPFLRWFLAVFIN